MIEKVIPVAEAKVKRNNLRVGEYFLLLRKFVHHSFTVTNMQHYIERKAGRLFITVVARSELQCKLRNTCFDVSPESCNPGA